MYALVPSSESQKNLEKSYRRWGANICTIITDNCLRLAQRRLACLVALKATRQAPSESELSPMPVPPHQTLHASQWQAERKTKLLVDHRQATPRSRDLDKAYLGLGRRCSGEIVLRSPQPSGCAGLECLNRSPAQQSARRLLSRSVARS